MALDLDGGGSLKNSILMKTQLLDLVFGLKFNRGIYSTNVARGWVAIKFVP